MSFCAEETINEEYYNEYLQTKNYSGSAFPDQNRLFYNNVQFYQCRDCGFEVEDMDEFIDHRIDNGCKSDPKVHMKQEFLDLVESSRIMKSATGILNSTLLKNSEMVTDVRKEVEKSFFNESGIYDVQDISQNFSNLSNLSNSTSNLSNSLISSLNTTHSKTFHCNEPNCNFIGFSSTQLNTHTRSVHYKTKCEECGKSYANQKCLKQHQQRVHQKIIKAHCEMCGLGFYSNAAVKAHKKNCSGGFKNDSTVLRHERAGDEVEKYRLHCRFENCEKFYTSLCPRTVGARRMQHERKHAATDRYECHFCGDKFEEFTKFAGHLMEGECEKSGVVRRVMQGVDPMSVLEAELVDGVRESFT